MSLFNRRQMLFTGGAALLAGPTVAQELAQAETYPIPAQHQAQVVDIRAGFAPGEIHVDPGQFALYWTLPDGKAIKYPVGIGKEGRYQSGTFRMQRTAEWPSWTPTKNMIRREPQIYAKFAGGMPGGGPNPLGARALYLYRGGKDSLLRIHGTPQPENVGRAVSNGCVRMYNPHVIDLAQRVPRGARVVLH